MMYSPFLLTFGLKNKNPAKVSQRGFVCIDYVKDKIIKT